MIIIIIFLFVQTFAINLLFNQLPTYYYTWGIPKSGRGTIIIYTVNVGSLVSKIIINDFNITLSGQSATAQSFYLGVVD